MNHPYNGIELKDGPKYWEDWIKMNEPGARKMEDWLEPCCLLSDKIKTYDGRRRSRRQPNQKNKNAFLNLSFPLPKHIPLLPMLQLKFYTITFFFLLSTIFARATPPRCKHHSTGNRTMYVSTIG